MQTTTTESVTYRVPVRQYQTTLDSVEAAIRDGNVAAGLEELFDDLSVRREDRQQQEHRKCQSLHHEADPSPTLTAEGWQFCDMRQSRLTRT